MAGRNLLLLHLLLLLLLVAVARARGFGVFGSSRRYGGTHRPGWAWTSGIGIGHRHQINGHQYMMKGCNGDILCMRVKNHYILRSLGSTVFRPQYRRNYGGKKGIFNFFGVPGNSVENYPPTSSDGVDTGLIAAPRSDSSEVPAGWHKDWEALVPNLLDSTPAQKLTVEWPNFVRAEAGNVIEVMSHFILEIWS